MVQLKKTSQKQVSLPLCGDSSISFNHIEIFTRDKKKVNSRIINIKDINKLPSDLKKKNIKWY